MHLSRLKKKLRRKETYTREKAWLKKTDEELTGRESLDTNTKRRLMLNVSSHGVMMLEESELPAAMAVGSTIPGTSPLVDAGKNECVKRSKRTELTPLH
jgi:hypothetical protein